MPFDEHEHANELEGLRHQPALTTPVSSTRLDGLINAALELPGARIAGRDAGMIRVTLGDTQQLIFLLDERSLVERIREVQAELRWGARVTFVAFESPTAVEQLHATVPSPWRLGKAAQAAATWSAEGGLRRVRSSSPALRSAAGRVSTLPARSLEESLAQRETELEASTRFVELLPKRPAVTIGIAIVSVAVFLLQLLWGGGAASLPVARMGAGIASLVSTEPWRLLAPMLLHANAIHLFLNLSALISFGGFLERLLGWQRYALLYVVSGLGGALLSSARTTDVVSVGASGGVWGLMVAGAVLVTFPGAALPTLTASTMRARVWSPVAVNAFYSLQPGIDLLAHLGGGLTGALLVLVMARALPPAAEVLAGRRRSVGPVASVGAGLALALVVAAVGYACARGSPWEFQAGPSFETVELPGQLAAIEVPASLQFVQHSETEFTFGRLLTDPVAIVVELNPERLTEQQANDPVGTLNASKDTLRTDLDGFARVGELVVTSTAEGRAELVASLASTDGRTAQSTWVLDRGRLAWVVVFATGKPPAAWSEAMSRPVRTLRLR